MQKSGYVYTRSVHTDRFAGRENLILRDFVKPEQIKDGARIVTECYTAKCLARPTCAAFVIHLQAECMTGSVGCWSNRTTTWRCLLRIKGSLERHATRGDLCSQSSSQVKQKHSWKSSRFLWLPSYILPTWAYRSCTYLARFQDAIMLPCNNPFLSTLYWLDTKCVCMSMQTCFRFKSVCTLYSIHDCQKATKVCLKLSVNCTYCIWGLRKVCRK